jgi:hypothetical protein
MTCEQVFHQNLFLGLIADAKRAVPSEIPTDRDSASDILACTIARLPAMGTFHSPRMNLTAWCKDVDTRPRLSGSPFVKMLMRSETIVVSANVLQRPFQVCRISDHIGREQLLNCSDEAFDAAVWPRTPGVRALMPDAQELQSPTQISRAEDGFIIRAHEPRSAIAPNGLCDVLHEPDARLIRQPLQPQTGPARMVHDCDRQVLTTRVVSGDQQIHAPDQVARQGMGHAVFQLATGFQNEIRMPTERTGHIRFAHRHPAAHRKAPVEVMGNQAASRLRHQRFQPDDFSAHPCGFGMGTEAVDGLTAVSIPSMPSAAQPQAASQEKPQSCTVMKQPSQDYHRVHLAHNVSRTETFSVFVRRQFVNQLPMIVRNTMPPITVL